MRRRSANLFDFYRGEYGIPPDWSGIASSTTSVSVGALHGLPAYSDAGVPCHGILTVVGIPPKMRCETLVSRVLLKRATRILGHLPHSGRLQPLPANRSFWELEKKTESIAVTTRGKLRFSY